MGWGAFKFVPCDCNTLLYNGSIKCFAFMQAKGIAYGTHPRLNLPEVKYTVLSYAIPSHPASYNSTPPPRSGEGWDGSAPCQTLSSKGFSTNTSPPIWEKHNTLKFA